MLSRVRITRPIATAALLAALVPAPAEARQLTIDGRLARGTYVFTVTGVTAPSVRSARLVVGANSRRLSLARVRAGVRRGRVRIPARGGARRSRTATASVRPRLRLTTPSPSSPTPGGLAWGPPALSKPTTLTLGTGSNYFRLDNQRDYVVRYPSATKVGQLMIEGGRNITIIGGQQRDYAGSGAALVYFTDNGTNGAPVTGRVIHVEGLNIDMAGGEGRDVFGLQTPTAIVQLVNNRAMNVHGAGGGVHGDIVQNYSDLEGLRVDRLTGSSDYQGFFIRPREGLIKNVDLRRVNLTAKPNGADAYTQLLYFVNDDGAAPRLHLDSFYIQNNRPGQDAQDAVYPDATATGMQSSFDGTRVTFPTFPQVTGAVYDGNPPAGDYVPTSAAGLGYATPGYAG